MIFVLLTCLVESRCHTWNPRSSFLWLYLYVMLLNVDRSVTIPRQFGSEQVVDAWVVTAELSLLRQSSHFYFLGFQIQERLRWKEETLGERGTQLETIRGRVLERRGREAQWGKTTQWQWQTHKAEQLKNREAGKKRREEKSVYRWRGVGKKQREEVWEFPGINLQCFTTLSLLLSQCRWRILSVK